MEIEIRTNAIFKPKEQLEEPIYAYIREVRETEVGFSVLGELTWKPDFSSCGVFWLSPMDFDDFFEEV